MRIIVLAAVLLAACASGRDELVIPVQDKPMVLIAGGVYAEAGLTDAEHGELLRAQSTAAANVKEYFGLPRRGLPITLFCYSAKCKMTFGAPAAAAPSSALGFARDGLPTQSGFVTTPVVVVSGPMLNTPRILTHELVHAEMKAWAPYDALPTWFNEGLATWISNEPDCSSNPQVSNFDVTQLDTKAKWQAHIAPPGATQRTYCQARDEAGLWASKFPDKASVGAAIKERCLAASDEGR